MSIQSRARKYKSFSYYLANQQRPNAPQHVKVGHSKQELKIFICAILGIGRLSGETHPIGRVVGCYGV